MSKLRNVGVKFFSTSSFKRTAETISVSKSDGYYKNIEHLEGKNSAKPPGWEEARPYGSIPGPEPLPLIGNMWRFMPVVGEYYNIPQKTLFQSLKDKYGNIVTIKGILGRKPVVVVFDDNDMETVFRNEGIFPIRGGVESIVHYRKVVRKDVFEGIDGAAVLHGEPWYKFRKIVNPILMQPRVVQQNVGKMDTVASELVENIRYFSKQNENKEMPEDFESEIYKWALESVGVVALDRHLGCLNLNAPKDSEPQRVIANVNEVFRLMYRLDVLPPIWKYIQTPSWKKFVTAMDFITETILKYIEEAMNKPIPEGALEHELSVVQRLAKVDKKIAVAMSMDMLFAGIDTTGKTLGAVLYFLARNPDKQHILRQESYQNLPTKSSPITEEFLNKSRYLKAVIKESLRISPIGIGNMRTSVKDMVLAEYQIPKGTDIMTMNLISTHSEQYKDHEKFIPERWLRTTVDEYSHKNAHPFAYLPFGFGPRSCIGKRLANLEMEVAVSKIVRNFELSWPHKDMEFSGNFLYGINNPLKLKVKEL